MFSAFRCAAFTCGAEHEMAERGGDRSEGKLKVPPLLDVIPFLAFNSFIIQAVMLTEWYL